MIFLYYFKNNQFYHVWTLSILSHSEYGRCKNTHDKSTSTINSPNYPSNYDDAQYCSWTITAPTGANIQIHRFNFSTESYSGSPYHGSDRNQCWDRISIYDGKICADNFLKTDLCGNGSYDGMISSGNNVCLEFVSTTSMLPSRTFTGFQLTYSIKGKHMLSWMLTKY